VALAVEKMSGSQNQLLGKLAEGLRSLASRGELGIDFSDQDIDELGLPTLKADLKKIVQQLNRLQESFDRGVKIQEGVRVAFLGLPNAGKSSFFNALLGEDRSIVSEIAGTTRDVVRERLTLRGKTSSITLRLEDTAGLRQTSDHVEKIGVQLSQKAAKDAELILFLVDPNSDFELVKKEWDALKILPGKAIGILTKIDQAKKGTLARFESFREQLSIQEWIRTSAMTGEGIERAIECMIQFCENWTRRKPGEVVLTRLDHLRAIEEAIVHLERADKAMELELFSADIRQALHSLSPLIGETVPDDILGKIFSEFCIGK
jgi:tRNA modification GTPase